MMLRSIPDIRAIQANKILKNKVIIPPVVFYLILSLGTNSIATSAMMKSHANKGATGENAIVVSSKKANIIVSPISIVMPNSMMGEVTRRMSEAVCDSEAFKILLPIVSENLEIVGLEGKPLSLLIKDAVKLIKKEFNIK